MTGGPGGASDFQTGDKAAALAPQNDLLRIITAIWHVRDEVPLPPGLSSDEALARIVPIFQARGTRHELSGDTLSFTKKDPAAQDRMAVFDSGVLRVEAGELGPVLRYHLVGRILLFCFLMPLVFLGFAQAAILLGKAEKPSAEAAADKAEKPEKKEPELKLNPVDAFLGAPAPEKPDKDKDTKKKQGEKDEEKEKKPSPTPAYVFAGIFAALYVIGRWLEAWLVKGLFRRRLWGA